MILSKDFSYFMFFLKDILASKRLLMPVAATQALHQGIHTSFQVNLMYHYVVYFFFNVHVASLLRASVD